ncbi:MAG: hypothetical protein K8L99_10905 [Anaerolineae bacterium]|nr:hypothetical protein [Anaerolineae bacterium]
MSAIARHHNEWLEFLEPSGPFLTLPVLVRVFPQGLPKVDGRKLGRLRAAYEEWANAQDAKAPDASALHATWVQLILGELLEFDDQTLRSGDGLPSGLVVPLAEHHETLRPSMAIVEPSGRAKAGTPRLLVAVWPSNQDIESAVPSARWAASPLERMTQLCRATGVRLGLVTNGERWTVVDAPVGQTAGYASWYAGLWLQEPITLAAFDALLGVRRFFAVADTDTIEAMLDESVAFQQEVTDQLGYQVRRAVEVLVQALDRADLDRKRELLRDVPPARLYDAALTVMMRLVFLFCAEERGLLLLGDETYDANYAVSTLRTLLREEADRVGVEVLERRQDAWARFLATFRAVHGGVEHEALRLPALGGSLFDPDRFPFLEGRAAGTSWLDTPASPLPIDNRTVLHLLEALQLLRTRGDGGTSEARKLSYRALDIEQIGHVYEGLLDHVAVRVDADTLGLTGTKDKEPELSLDDLNRERRHGMDGLIGFLKEHTGRATSALRNELDAELDEVAEQRLLVACGNDKALVKHIAPYHALIRKDVWGYPQIYRAGSFMVTGGSERHQTGTHYTPKSLTEQIVIETLEPLVYVGPAEGKPRDAWKLRSAVELLELKICDMAMGSGAFLVQVCRWLAERVVEAWEEAERQGAAISADGEVLEKAVGHDLLQAEREERLSFARRLVAERCVYGVDINPMAVELAKLSLWLVTLAKGRPFGFLDHNLRCGDSVLGIHRLEQLTELSMMPNGKGQRRLFGQNIERAVHDAIDLRQRLRKMPIRDIHDVEAMARLDADARQRLEIAESVADAFIGEVLASGGIEKALGNAVASLAIQAGQAIAGNREAYATIVRRAEGALNVDLPVGKPCRRPFHWPLEFPEVFLRQRPGFDALVGNPPFLGNRLWRGAMGDKFQWQCQMVLGTSPAKIDLCVVFHRRAFDLLQTSGCYGLLATSNIAEGGAIQVGLGVLVQNGSIFFAKKDLPWPGTAAVSIAVVCLFKGRWRADCVADGQKCARIGPRLEPESIGLWTPQVLADAPFAFAGVDNSKGLAFLITAESAWFERLKSEADSLLRPYINGDDITSSALNRIERWALDIGDRPLDEIAKRWPIAMQFLMEAVKPARTAAALKSYEGLSDRWWQFWRHRADLMRRLRTNTACIAYSKVTKYPICMLADSNWIYSNRVVLVAVERVDMLAICLSSPFRSWLERYCGGGYSGVIGISISESIATYPIPNQEVPRAGIDAASRFNRLAIEFGAARKCGLTDVMNAVNMPSESDSGIAELRRLMAAIDSDVLTAYGWGDVEIDYDFREFQAGSVNDPWRWAVSSEVATELLHRLNTLNRERVQESSTAGRVATVVTSSKRGRRAKGAPAAVTGGLFDGEAE